MAVQPASAPVAGDHPARRELRDAPFLAAVRGRRPARLPVWFMRQAGRSLPEYRALRADTSMLAACFDPELTCEITLQPVRRHGVDAAILFSDIVATPGPRVDQDVPPTSPRRSGGTPKPAVGSVAT